MQLSALPSSLLFALVFQGSLSAAASDDKPPKVVDPCTVTSPAGLFYDLRSLTASLPVQDKKPGKNDRLEDWHARGWDYGSNFTLNLCAPVVKEVDNVEEIDRHHYQNISAYYDVGSKRYSIGQQSSNLTVRGRRLVLQYTNGSPCGSTKKRSPKRAALPRWDDDESDKNPSSTGRKSTIISFHCDKDPLAKEAAVTFVGTDPDECSYHFEVLSTAACVTSEPAKQGVGPAAVFAIIGVIAILVYFLGGVFYQRNVAHARGWRQLPNYSMWAGIGGFIKDIFIIATSSCSRLFPSRRGYSALSVSANGNGRGRGNRAEDENRLIDQLDEEWDD